MTTRHPHPTAAIGFTLFAAASMTGVASICFWVFNSGRLDAGQRIAAFVALFVTIAVLTGVVTAIQTHRFGGWTRRRSFTRAVSKDGVLPDDADPAIWRPRLVRLLAVSSPVGLWVIWTWFGVVMMVSPQAAKGHTNPLGLGVLAVLGVVVGLVVSWSMAGDYKKRLDNARRLLEQIDAKARA